MVATPIRIPAVFKQIGLKACTPARICANHAKSHESITWLTSPQLAQSVSMPSDPPSHRGLLELWRQCCGTLRQDQILLGSAAMPGFPYLQRVRLSKMTNRKMNTIVSPIEILHNYHLPFTYSLLIWN